MISSPALFRLGENCSKWWAKLQYVTRQLRLQPRPDQTDQRNARAYSVPLWRDAYAASAGGGLYESELILADRYFRPGQVLLDVGCGGGREAFGFVQRGLKVIAIDVCSELIDAAKARAEKLGVEDRPAFFIGSLTALDFPPASFDVVYLSSDIYAGTPGSRNRVKVLEQCARIMRPGGLVIFPVNLSPPDSVRVRLLVEAPRNLVRWLFPELVPEPGDRWALSGTAPNPPVLFRHLFFNEEEVVSETKRAGLRFVERTFDFFVTQSPGAAQTDHIAVRSAPRVHPSVAAQSYGNELLLVHLENGGTFSLNETARRMWELINDGCSPKEVAERLAAHFDASKERLEADAAELIRQLEAEAVLNG